MLRAHAKLPHPTPAFPTPPRPAPPASHNMARARTHLGVGGKLGGQAQVVQQVLHVLGGQRLAQQASGSGLLRQGDSGGGGRRHTR